jgi:hypothetical protein
MPFTPKVWKDLPERSTPLNAESLIDLETRLSNYTDLAVGYNFFTTPTGVSENMAREIAQTSTGIGAANWLTQVALYLYVVPRTSMTVSKIRTVTGTSAASGLTLARNALYTVDSSNNLTLVARTANTATMWNSTNTVVTQSFDTTGGYPATYAVTAGVKYAIGLLGVGTTRPVFFGATGLATMFAQTPVFGHQQTAQADLPTSVAVGALAAWAIPGVPYVALVQ